MTRKQSDEKSLFDEWEADYFVVPNTASIAACLICREDIPKNVHKIEDHFFTNHNLFDETFPKGTRIRNEKLAFLKNSFLQALAQQNVASESSQEAAVIKATYEICYILGKNMKTLADAEIVKGCFLTAANLLFDKYHNKQHLMLEIEKMELSESACVRRIEDISKIIQNEVIESLKTCKFFSLAIDPSVAVSSTSQCSVHVRYCTEDNFILEDFLTFLPMNGLKNGADYVDAISNYLQRHNINLKNIVCVCTDGSVAMTGSENGFITLFKNKYATKNLFTIQCITHHENIAARSVNPSIEAVMKTVANIINVILISQSKDPRFQSLIEEVGARDAIPLSAVINWLGSGKVLERFFNKRQDIVSMLQHNKNFPEAKKVGWWFLVGFLCDINEKLTKFNQSLQGENKIVSQIANKIFAFEEKLSIYYTEVQNRSLQNFPTATKFMQVQRVSITDQMVSTISNYLIGLRCEFDSRYKDLKKIQCLLILVENPWYLESTQISQFATLFNCNYVEFFDEIIEMKNDMNLLAVFKEKKANKEYAEFWAIVPDQYQTVQRCAQILLTLFVSMEICELSYHKVKYAKRVYNKLEDYQLDAMLRVACSVYKPNLDAVVTKEDPFSTISV